MTPITFFVPGLPKPGGSKRGFVNPKNGRVIITDACKSGKDWKSAVSYCGRQAYSGPLLDCALEVSMTFVMPRANGHYGKRGLKPSAPLHPTKKPDVLKLARSTEDALTNIIWRDDSRTIRLVLEKQYGEQPGAHITVRPLAAARQLALGEVA